MGSKPVTCLEVIVGKSVQIFTLFRPISYFKLLGVMKDMSTVKIREESVRAFGVNGLLSFLK